MCIRDRSYMDLPEALDAQSLRCLRMCMWEPSDVAPAIDTADVEGERKTRVGRHRFWLREAATCPGSRIPMCLVPNALVQYLRTALGVLTTENQRAAVRVVQAALRGLYLMERARAAQIAYHMALLGISTPTTLHTHRGTPSKRFGAKPAALMSPPAGSSAPLMGPPPRQPSRISSPLIAAGPL